MLLSMLLRMLSMLLRMLCLMLRIMLLVMLLVLVRVGDSAAVYERLLRSGVIVRPVGGYGLPEWLRVSIGLPAENEAFLSALAAALGR
jgi:hypothetical protein